MEVDLFAPLFGQVRNLESGVSGLILEQHGDRDAWAIRLFAVYLHDFLQRIDIE